MSNVRDEIRLHDCRDDLVNPRHLTAFRHPNGNLGMISFGGSAGTVRLQITEADARWLASFLLQQYCELPGQRTAPDATLEAVA